MTDTALEPYRANNTEDAWLRTRAHDAMHDTTIADDVRLVISELWSIYVKSGFASDASIGEPVGYAGTIADMLERKPNETGNPGNAFRNDPIDVPNNENISLQDDDNQTVSLKRSDVKEALLWLRSALDCEKWDWSPDQYGLAEDALHRVMAAIDGSHDEAVIPFQPHSCTSLPVTEGDKALALFLKAGKVICYYSEDGKSITDIHELPISLYQKMRNSVGHEVPVAQITDEGIAE